MYLQFEYHVPRNQPLKVLLPSSGESATDLILIQMNPSFMSVLIHMNPPLIPYLIRSNPALILALVQMNPTLICNLVQMSPTLILILVLMYPPLILILILTNAVSTFPFSVFRISFNVILSTMENMPVARSSVIPVVSSPLHFQSRWLFLYPSGAAMHACS